MSYPGLHTTVDSYQQQGNVHVPYDAHVPMPSPSAMIGVPPSHQSTSIRTIQYEVQQQPQAAAAAAAAGVPHSNEPHQSLHSQSINQPNNAVGIDGRVIPVPSHPPARVLLPLGAVPMNGGVWFTSNVFTNSYRIPGPRGSEYIYYDNSIPMPPCHSYPTLSEQWHSLTRLLKLFLILLIIFWFIQLTYHWKVGICIPILFGWSYLLYRQWQKHYDQIELYMVVKLYAIGFAPGALIVMIVESIVTILFAILCFQSYISDFLKKFEGTADSNGSGDSTGKSHGGSSNNNNDIPDGMEFLNYKQTPSLFIFLFLLSYVSAGVVEESLKYYLTNRVRKYRPSYKFIQGYLLYALSAALGFSTVENIGYVLGGASSSAGGDPSFVGILVNTLGRACLSTPLHLLTAYLIGLQIVRRDLLGESLNLAQVMGWSIFFHGTFDFGLFLVMTLNRFWSSGPEDVTISYILMACIVANCYAGLGYRIWKTRRMVFPHGSYEQEIEHAVEDVEAPPDHPSISGDSVDSVGAGHIQIDSGSRRANGFAPLQQQP